MFHSKEDKMKFFILYSLIDGGGIAFALGYLFVAIIVELTDNGSIDRAGRKIPGGFYRPIQVNLSPVQPDDAKSRNSSPDDGFPQS
jgi:hypothetical protein